MSLARAASAQQGRAPCWIFPCASPDPVSMLHPPVGPGWLACVDCISHPGFPSRRPWQGIKQRNVYVSAPSLLGGLSPFTEGHGSHGISPCWVRARGSLLFLRVGLLMSMSSKQGPQTSPMMPVSPKARLLLPPGPLSILMPLTPDGFTSTHPTLHQNVWVL